MKKLLLLITAIIFSCNSSQKTVVEVARPLESDTDPVAFASTITEEELKEHLYTYASDEFQGRETGKPGQKKAVEYIKAEYKSLGIPALKSDGDYFQKVALSISNVPVGKIMINEKPFQQGEDFLTFSKAEGQLNNLVYVGYGIEEGEYSDYSNLDVKDKVVLMKSGEPKNEDGSYIISGSDEKSVWSNMSESIGKRVELATKKGAKGVLYYDPDNFSRYKRYYQFMKNNNSGRMQLTAETTKNFLILLKDKMVKELYPELKDVSAPTLLPAKIDLQVASADTQIDSENVAAFLKGSELPNEYVVISSHLDHIGVTEDGQVNNGADDDGSGTVAMLEIAEAFKRAADKGMGPKRSIVFLHVTGEEKGLLGSKYYTDFEPLAPLESTVANLNIDMIGRIDPKRQGDRNYVYLIGSDKLSTELHELSETVNTTYTNLELDYAYNDENDPNRFYYRSDHYNFAKNNIPIIFYFNGTHDDYHRPGDTPDKINYDLLKHRSQLIFHTAWEVANKEDRLIVDKASK
ncbi:MAG: M28 family peptidase [Bacteroidota bacterium]